MTPRRQLASVTLLIGARGTLVLGEAGPSHPEVLSGESVVVVTAVKPGGVFTMNVKKVRDDSDCEEEEEPQGPDECELAALCEPSSYYWSDLVPVD
jgi:hypothetical protein